MSGDNYINAIYSSTGSVSLDNVTYWGSNGKSNNKNPTLNDKNGHNLTIELLDKATEASLGANQTKVTNATGNISVVGLDNSKYYKVNVYHYTGDSRYESFSDEIAGSGVVVSKLELIVPEIVEKGGNLTVVAIVNSTATGNVTFIFNTSSVNVTIVNGIANWTTNVNFGPGEYVLSAIYNGGNGFYGQRNESTITVKVPVIPTATINTNSSLVVNSSVSIESLTNFNVTSLGKQFELVELKTFEFHHTSEIL